MNVSRHEYLGPVVCAALSRGYLFQCVGCWIVPSFFVLHRAYSLSLTFFGILAVGLIVAFMRRWMQHMHVQRCAHRAHTSLLTASLVSNVFCIRTSIGWITLCGANFCRETMCRWCGAQRKPTIPHVHSQHVPRIFGQGNYKLNRYAILMKRATENSLQRVSCKTSSQGRYAFE